jgi:RNA polymerase sigma-70 factor (ECF subfamily)
MEEGETFLLRSATHDGVADLLFHDSLAHIRTALSALNDEEQVLINSALFDPATNAQLANRWGIPVGTVKTRIHRAMEKLRHLLRPSNPFKS